MNLNSIIYLESSLEESAREWARRLSLNSVDGSSVSPNAKARQEFIRERCLSKKDGFALVLDSEGLALHTANFQGKYLSICADFHGVSTIYRRKRGGGKRQMIARAVGIEGRVPLRVLDATAGLGKDAFVLASLGCQVTLLERMPIIHALLEDAVRRARAFGISKDPDLLEILDRMEVMNTDALDYMESCSGEKRPDVVYLDPMFPPRTKSAQVKKEMQALQQLLGADAEGADALLKAALKIARSRVVVKRSRTSPALSGPKPSHTLEGKRNRFDVYMVGTLES